MHSDFSGRGRRRCSAKMRRRLSSLLVIRAAPIDAAQDVIRLVQRLHVFFRATPIRVMLVRLSLIQTFDVARRCIFARAEDRVIIRL